MKALYKILIIILLTNCGNPEPSTSKLQLTGDIKADINSILPEGRVTVDLMDSIVPSPRREELVDKFQNGVMKNMDWFINYQKSFPLGQVLPPYHSNMGITESEYKELIDSLNELKIISRGTEEIDIIKNEDVIQFKSKGKLEVLEAISFDLKNNVVMMANFDLLFQDTINITDEGLGLRTKCKGYYWSFEEPKDVNLDTLKDFSNLTIKGYKLKIGRLETNGKTFMEIRGNEFENGSKIVDFKRTITF